MIKQSLCALAGAALLGVAPASPAAAAETCATAEAAPKPKKKRGFGLGGILKAANQAGVGSMLGYGNLLGSGKMGQVAGAIAGTAVNAADGGASAQGSASHLGGLMGGHRVAQVAGAVTGTAANLARQSGSGQRKDAASDSGACAADPAGPVVRLYK